MLESPLRILKAQRTGFIPIFTIFWRFCRSRDSNASRLQWSTSRRRRPSHSSYRPHTRRRSFRLDIIKSTTRPRMKFPTPRPREFRTRRISHPSSLANGIWVFPWNIWNQKLPPPPVEIQILCHGLPLLFTLPYDGTADRASYISTVSSHDSTTHHRVNTSFDPAMTLEPVPHDDVGWVDSTLLNWIMICMGWIDDSNKKTRILLRS